MEKTFEKKYQVAIPTGPDSEVRRLFDKFRDDYLQRMAEAEAKLMQECLPPDLLCEYAVAYPNNCEVSIDGMELKLYVRPAEALTKYGQPFSSEEALIKLGFTHVGSLTVKFT